MTRATAARRKTIKKNTASAHENPIELVFGMLARRPLSEGEVKVRLLRKSIPESAIPPVLARLRDLGLLDDSALCRQLARSYRETRIYGPAKIAWKLASRGFPRSLVEEAMRDECAEEDVAAAAVLALRKKYRGGIPPGREGASKAYRFLAGRGFPPEICRRAIGRRRTETEGDE
ncbi:MAG: RecX family transcriptional regulator [Syntrophorhabdaceae bacterium]|nr:RecX family transcriptional regulator [Syntrophorhabdaceae bacterium]